MLAALVLLSLALPQTTAATSDADIVVKVVDKDGKPVEGVQVGLCPHWSGHSSTFGIGVSDRDGSARIKSGLDTVRKDTQHSFFVRLGAPFDPDVRAEIDREHLDDFHPTLVVPEHGRVVLALPAVADEQCHARLRVVPRAPEELGAIWSGSSLPQIPCKAHQAACEFVGLGLEIEYEVLGSSLPQPLHGTFRGPTKAGELVRVEVPGFESSPKIRVRLIDEDSRPVARVRLQWSLSTHSESPGHGSFGWKGGEVVTDESGIALIPLSAELALQTNRTFALAAVLDATKGQPIENAALKLPVADEFHEGELDLGQQVLAHFGSPAKFKNLDDKALERRFLELVPSPMRESDEDGDGHVEILYEMIRRGGAELERFVADCAAKVPGDWWQSPWGKADALVLRTALARIRRQPEPISIFLRSNSCLDVSFPELPSVDCELANTDMEGHSFPICQYHNDLCRIEAKDSDGRLLPQRASTPYGGMDSEDPLSPGRCHPIYADLGTLVFPGPGEYRVRIYHSPNEDLDRLTSMRGRIVISSTEFTVHIRPCTIEITQSRMDELRAAVRALDIEKSVPLVRDHWSEWTKYPKPAEAPEDVLFRAGREALPALLEALEDSSLDPRRRAWIFGMLWNIAGTFDLCEERWHGVLKDAHQVGKWPSVEGADNQTSPISSWGFPDADAQAELARLWLLRKAFFELRILPQ